MRNNLLAKKIIACFLIMIIVISVVCVPTFAAYDTFSNIERGNENCSTLYFSELRTYFGRNVEETCSYVAAAMLLSYYDSFQNGDFIDEVYESSGNLINYGEDKMLFLSPGIKKEPDWNSTSYSSYESFVDDLADEYLHLKLIEIGKNVANAYDSEHSGSIYDTDGNIKVSDDLSPSEIDWSVSIPKVAEITQTYLTQQGISSAEVTVNSLSYRDLMTENPTMSETEADALIRQIAIEKVNEGIPIVYAGFSTDVSNNIVSGHALIAYDTIYNSTLDNYTLVFHTGWDNSTIINENDPIFIYDHKLYIMWIDINASYFHECDENFVVQSPTGDTSTECMCTFPMHPEHNHEGVYINYTSDSHNVNCKWCNIVSDYHFPFNYERNNKIGHYVYCECGYQMGTSHHVVPIGGIGFKLCIYCGERLDTSIDITPVPGTNSVSICYITEAGSYVNADGVVFLVDSDMTLLLEGQLDVEALVTVALGNSVTE